jgi:hypothetical protein
MKKLLYGGLALIMFFSACKKDNFDAPESKLQGQIVYQNQPVGVRSNGVQVELWQHGYKLFSKIPVYVSQDGAFSAALKSGDYKLVLLRGNGPWADNSDSIDVKVSGTTTVNINVDPYFIISNASFQQAGSAVTSTFNIQRVNTSKNLEAVKLFLSKTEIVDQTNNLAASQINAANIVDLTQTISLTTNIPAALVGKAYVFARVGVKIAGVSELVYSPVQKVEIH